MLKSREIKNRLSTLLMKLLIKLFSVRACIDGSTHWCSVSHRHWHFNVHNCSYNPNRADTHTHTKRHISSFCHDEHSALTILTWLWKSVKTSAPIGCRLAPPLSLSPCHSLPSSIISSIPFLPHWRVRRITTLLMVLTALVLPNQFTPDTVQM